jgi:hypothetical protein
LPGYYRLRFRLPPELEDELAAELWVRGSIGVELKADGPRVVLDAYFAAPPDPVWLAAGPLPGNRDVELLGSTGVPDTDWLAVHRSISQPFEIGDR